MAEAYSNRELPESEKASHVEVGYTLGHRHEKRCGVCRHYIPAGRCESVKKPISPNGWCQRFEQKYV